MASYFKGNFKFDAEQFKRKCARLGAEFGDMGEFVLADQMRLLGIDILRNSPPGPSKGDQTRFQKIVTGDIRKVIHGMTRDGLIAILKRRFGGNRSAIEGRYNGQAKFNVNGDAGEIYAYHQSRRERFGKVPGKPEQIGTLGIGTGWKGGTRTVATMPIFNKMYVPKRALDKYIKDRIAKVGILMGGAIPAIEEFARIVKSPITGRQVPTWVAKAWAAAGKKDMSMPAENDFDKGKLRGTMTLHHRVPWNDMLRNVTTRALAKRQADLENNVRKRLPSMIRRFHKVAA